MKLRSKWQFGIPSEARRGLVHGMGYADDEMEKPLIGIINSWNDYNPGHVHLDKLAQRVKDGVREAGGFPMEVQTTALCDGVVLEDPKYIELHSIVPGHLMGAARVNLPTIVVTGGYMPMGKFEGKEAVCTDTLDYVGKVLSGQVSKEEYLRRIHLSHYPCGACGTLTTANSMTIVAEAMGLTLSGNSSMDAASGEILQTAYNAGKQIMYLLKNDIKARDIITPAAVRNSIRATIAVAGSINLVMHIPAIAQEAGLDMDWWKEFDKISNSVPHLASIRPGGKYHLKYFDLAGGTPAMLKNLLPQLEKDCMTVSGNTIEENVKDAQVYNSDVIKTLDDPVENSPGIGVLYGNIAEEGAIVKIAAVQPHLFKFRGPARVYDDLAPARADLRSGKIKEGDAIVVRYLGPKGRFGTTAYIFQEELKGFTDLFDSCAIITDGRYSGATSGLSIGYVSPEAALGGNLAIIGNGDMIEIDIDKRKINLEVSNEEIQKRQKTVKLKAAEVPDSNRSLRLFVNNIASTAKGAIWKW